MMLSYFLFKVKNRSFSRPGQRKLYNTEVSIIYENPPEPVKEEPVKNDISKRYIVLNEINEESPVGKANRERHVTTNRFYIYKPRPYKAAKILEKSPIHSLESNFQK
jgi:hypothetical protein